MIPQEITAFYNKHKTRLYNIALRITGDSFEAEEIVQDTIIKYLRNNTVKMSEQQIEAWLSKACARASVDMLRLRKGLKMKLENFAQEDPEEDSSDGWDGYLSSAEPGRTIRRIRELMMRLPDGYRVVLSLLLFEGYDYAEAAQILQVAESTVRSQYLRGKRKLLTIINENKETYHG